MARFYRLHAHGGAMFSASRRLGVVFVGLAAFLTDAALGQDLERDPINYSAATPRNAVERLRERLGSGSTKLDFEPVRGYLRSLLRELDVSESSQVLVFSKTSMQRDRISPKSPRAIYFNDDVMVGFCLHGNVIELSAPDEAIGTAFYTIDQARDEPPSPQRQTESCLVCHGSSVTRGFPSHLVRSLYVDRQGNPMLSAGSFRTDHSSPLAERWGGWYVTGTSGGQKHMGNTIQRDLDRSEPLETAGGVNVVDLKGRFPMSRYLTPHSDIVGLMVLEHQVGMLNHLSRAGLETRMAMHYQHEMNKAFGQPLDEPSESAWSRIRNVGDAVVRYMLFDDETRLTDRVEGTSSFTSDFAKRGPRDSKGRSLRDFDLQTRLFRYPCSYMIYSRAYDSLPSEVKDHVYRRLWDILNGRGTGKDDPKLDEADRRAILEILRETKCDLPDYWKTPEPSASP
jgi:hypothetical protein